MQCLTEFVRVRRFIIKLSQQIDFVVSHFSACFSSRRLSKSIRLIVSCIVKKAFSWMFSQLLCGGLVYHLCGVCIVCVVVWCIICVVFASFVWWFGALSPRAEGTEKCCPQGEGLNL